MTILDQENMPQCTIEQETLLWNNLQLRDDMEEMYQNLLKFQILKPVKT